MRTRVHMASMLALMSASLAAQGPIVAPTAPRPSREPAPTRRTLIDTGKPPMNGKREVARRLRQMQRKATKDAALSGDKQTAAGSAP